MLKSFTNILKRKMSGYPMRIKIWRPIHVPGKVKHEILGCRKKPKRSIVLSRRRMINKHFLSIIFCLISFVQLLALPIIKLDKSIHDFGTIKEEDGEVRHTFVFVNEGDSDLILEKVKPS